MDRQGCLFLDQIDFDWMESFLWGSKGHLCCDGSQVSIRKDDSVALALKVLDGYIESLFEIELVVFHPGLVCRA